MRYNTVVTTYTRQPEIIPVESSETCRDGVYLPLLSGRVIMAAGGIEALYFPEPPAAGGNREERRLWAILQFRLPRKLVTLGLDYLHRPSCNEMADFQRKFQKKAILRMSDPNNNTKQRLLECSRLCSTHTCASDIYKRADVSLLLLGLSQSEQEERFKDAQLHNVIVLPNQKISLELETLLSSSDPELSVYSHGRHRFSACFDRYHASQGRPLEEAFTWTLACRAARENELNFLSKCFKVSCTKIAGTRIFDDNTMESFNPDHLKVLESGVVYFANEPGRGDAKDSHPLVDIMIRTDDNELILIDVTASPLRSTSKSGSKVGKLKAFIEEHQGTVLQQAQLKLHGVVLAPFDDHKTRGSFTRGDVSAVCGQDARELLGGLDQIFRWFSSSEV